MICHGKARYKLGGKWKQLEIPPLYGGLLASSCGGLHTLGPKENMAEKRKNRRTDGHKDNLIYISRITPTSAISGITPGRPH